MEREQVIALAREAGFESHDVTLNFRKELERFAALVAEATKEKAAKVCEGFTADMRHQSKEAYSFSFNCAAAIRNMK